MSHSPETSSVIVEHGETTFGIFGFLFLAFLHAPFDIALELVTGGNGASVMNARQSPAGMGGHGGGYH